MKLKKYKIIIITIIFIFNINISIINAQIPRTYAKSALLMERDSGRVIYSYNAHLKLPPASTTKIMTALIAIEYGNLDDIVKINEKSVGIEGSSIYLRKGEELTLRDLVYGLMLRSGNDAAVAIAYHISGSIDKFSALMNYKAKSIGAYNTNFTNPHGLHDENHYTTAYDLALITREALKYEEFRKVSSTIKYIANREENNYFYNKNKTLWQYKNGDGVKIGFTKKSGRCLVSSATRNNMQLIAVVLNDSNWFNDCYRLLDYGFKYYKKETIIKKNQKLKQIKVIDGQQDTLVIKSTEEITYPLRDSEISRIKIIVDLPSYIKAPIYKDKKIGEIKIFMDGKILKTIDLYVPYEIKKKTSFQRTIEYIRKIFM